MNKPSDHELTIFLRELLTYAPGHVETRRTPAELEEGKALCFDKARELLDRISPSPRTGDRDLPLTELALPVQTKILLSKMGIINIGHLLIHDSRDLLSCYGIGPAVLAQIEQAVAPFGGLTPPNIREAERRRSSNAIARKLALEEIKARAAGAEAALKEAIAERCAAYEHPSETDQSLIDALRRVSGLLDTQIRALDAAIEHQDEAGADEVIEQLKRTCQTVDLLIICPA